MKSKVKYINLFKLFWTKEIIWLARMKEMKSKVSLGSFIILFVLIFIGQHAFAFMHFLMETALFIFNRKAFSYNLVIMRKKIREQQNYFKIKKYGLVC